MAHAPNENPSPGKTQAPQREVLAELVRTAIAMANEQLTSLATRLADAMADMTTAGNDAQVAYRRTRAGHLLKSNAYAFVHLAGEAIERALRAEVDGLSPRTSGSADLALLSLVPMEEMDSKVAFGTLSRPFDIAHSEVLASLCVRLGLLLGRDVLRPGQNPFRPEVFLQAVHSAWREFEPDEGSHSLILPMLRPELFLDLGQMFDAIDAALRARSKAGRERFHIHKSSEASARRDRRRSPMDAELAQQLRALPGQRQRRPGRAAGGRRRTRAGSARHAARQWLAAERRDRLHGRRRHRHRPRRARFRSDGPGGRGCCAPCCASPGRHCRHRRRRHARWRFRPGAIAPCTGRRGLRRHPGPGRRQRRRGRFPAEPALEPEPGSGTRAGRDARCRFRTRGSAGTWRRHRPDAGTGARIGAGIGAGIR
ncbi:DUF1631 family protein [Massilia sp. Se16.2.3]|uniref:DUF1631 family protein n=1 Tax=Massilia sp. Se16.2.3 TaxID=2709303 RepID=UPI0035A69C85